MDDFSWDVITASRRATYRGAKRPCGSVRMSSARQGEEYLSVPAAVARVLLRKKKSGELDPQNPEQLVEAIGIVTQAAARERIAALLDQREYGTQEVRERLRCDGYEAPLIDEVLSRAVDAGLVSDERYAGSFIRSKLYAGWGADRIARELNRRGIDVTALQGWPYEYFDPEDEHARAREVARRKSVREPNAYAKLVRFLVGRGFSYSVATQVARAELDARAQEI